MPTQPRRQQRAITIRSEHALARLAILTRDGRSQAQVIEEALDRMPVPPQARSAEEVMARVRAITARGRNLPRISMAEFDEQEYDERGMPR
ncbi:hypothetical protein [Sphingopyxis sp. 113P3]|uniref:hypothetical protein n=1 Tax=Sphingopyxis sp. (strain 113P3) TaxID=292913 RepID=UPI0006AD38AA|nr:hypothetical protein [Sphingopyxis sp. 113P3]ALC11502.1 hypothetical protein LH20_05995 [Sphingopyxis sp. 113P3]